MANERKDNSAWKAARPPQGASGKEFAEWAKQNPNRKANANERLKEFNEEPTTGTVANTPARAEMVESWKSKRPSGKREEMIEWAKWNPNKGSNARRAKKDK
jgi:hypothetical protein